MSEKTNEDTFEILTATALREELNHIKHGISPNGKPIASNRQDGELSGVMKELRGANLSALCFSGGGIRSATFGLGVVQALAKHELLDKFDYLSTVSGGGYMGAWLSAWIRREQIKTLEAGRFEGKSSDVVKLENDELFEKYKKTQSCGVAAVQNKLNERELSDQSCPNPEPTQLQYLREYSNYMSPRVGLLSADTWTLAAIYARNLFLNWTIFIPLISAALLIPRILLAFTRLTAIDERLAHLTLLIGFLAGSCAVAFVVNKLPSKNTDAPEIKHNNDGWVLCLGVLPLMILAFAATTFWAWWNRRAITFDDFFNFLRPYFVFQAANIIVFTVLIFLVGYTLFHLTKRPRVKIDWRGIIAAVAASIVGGFSIWLVAHILFENDSFLRSRVAPANLLPLYVCIAVPVYLLTFSIASTVFAGLSSMFATDDDREWLARYGAWVFIVCVAWLALNTLVLLSPAWAESFIGSVKTLVSGNNIFSIEYLKSSIAPLIAVISGILSLAGGFSGKSPAKDEPAKKSNLSRFLAIAPQIAAVVFLGFLLVGLAYVSGVVIDSVGGSLNNLAGKIAGWQTFLNAHPNVFSQTSIVYLFVWLILLSAIGIGMAFYINVNKFSLHGAYRDRLIRAYLGASHITRKRNKFTGFDDTDNFQLHRLRGQKPFHIINATLNLVAGKNLAWQNRKAASFTMSPLHCGSWLLGYRYSNEYSRNPNLAKCAHLRFCNKLGEHCLSLEECEFPGKALRLGTAMAISGAAANPNMGYYSSPVVTFLMSLFNIRLGWWLGNTGKIGDREDRWGNKFYTKPSPSIAVLPLINETFGRTDENKRYLNITDGGHFENLGLYEMVLRRCKVIVLSDAAADENFTFGEISNAVEKCKVDLGVDIKFNDDIKIYARNKAKDIADRLYFAVAEIIYPETNQNDVKDKSYLLYIRPTFYGIEPTDIKHYADSNQSFPHQSTADELYDEKQFEAYRALGFFTMNKIIEERKQSENLSEMINNLRKNETRNAVIGSSEILPDLPRPESSDAV